MQVRFHDDFAKKQYKKLSGAYRAKNIALMACHFTNITFRYGGQYASDLALFIQKTEEWKRERAIALYMPKGTYSHFKGLSICKYPYPVFAKIKQIRKQEEAPEALAVDGAESSCPVKKILRCDHHIHADLIIKAGEQVEVIEKYPADSLVSHPQCKGFFAWNDQLEDLNSRRGGLREQLRNARKMQQEGGDKMKPLFGDKRRFPMGSLLLIKARKESGLKQTEFIERYGLEVNQPTFSRWESGKQQVPFDVLLKVGAIQPIEIG